MDVHWVETVIQSFNFFFRLLIPNYLKLQADQVDLVENKVVGAMEEDSKEGKTVDPNNTPDLVMDITRSDMEKASKIMHFVLWKNVYIFKMMRHVDEMLWLLYTHPQPLRRTDLFLYLL